MGTYNVINTYDYNPVHAIWYLLVDQLGMSESWLDSTSFLSAASQVHTEGLGIGLRMATHDAAQTYIQSLLQHIEGVIYYGADGKLHIKLVRDDYVVGNLPVLDVSTLLDEPQIVRSSFIDTYSEIKVQYNKRFSTQLPFDAIAQEIPVSTSLLLINGYDNWASSFDKSIDYETGQIIPVVRSPSFYEDGQYIYTPGQNYDVKLCFQVDSPVSFYGQDPPTVFYYEELASAHGYNTETLVQEGLFTCEVDDTAGGYLWHTRTQYRDDDLEGTSYWGWEPIWLFGYSLNKDDGFIYPTVKYCYAWVEIYYPDYGWVPSEKTRYEFVFDMVAANEEYKKRKQDWWYVA